MNEEQNQQQQQGVENHVGGEVFSRSENASPPTMPPAGAGVSPPWGPHGSVLQAADPPIWAELVDLPECEPEAVEGAQAGELTSAVQVLFPPATNNDSLPKRSGAPPNHEAQQRTAFSAAKK
jgi:hypothetical protein